MPQPRRVTGKLASKVVTLRMTLDEWTVLRSAADAAKVDRSTFLREAMLDRAREHGITLESLDPQRYGETDDETTTDSETEPAAAG